MPLEPKLAGIYETLKELEAKGMSLDDYVKALEQEILDRQSKIDRLQSLTRTDPPAAGVPTPKRRRRSDAGKHRKAAQSPDVRTSAELETHPAGTGAEAAAVV